MSFSAPSSITNSPSLTNHGSYDEDWCEGHQQPPPQKKKRFTDVDLSTTTLSRTMTMTTTAFAAAVTTKVGSGTVAPMAAATTATPKVVSSTLEYNNKEEEDDDESVDVKAENAPPVAFVETTDSRQIAAASVQQLDISIVSTDGAIATVGETMDHTAPSSLATKTRHVEGCTTTAGDDDGREKIKTKGHSENTEDAHSASDDPTSKDYYFDSYAHHAIHEEMLKDEVRTRTYEMAIMENKHLFQDKIILDVGCGTGILSMFAARAGAKHVYAVDCSSIAQQAREIVKINGFADRITVIQGKLEDIELPVPQVDVIVSEWMGYFLLYESMLDTVIYARDKWLVEDGIVFPDKAVLYVAAVEDGQVKRDRVDFWDNVYGFDMTPIKDIALTEPVVDIVDSKSVVTDAVQILYLDILTCTKEDLEFSSAFELTAKRSDYIHGLVAYFECAFTQVHKPIGFSTSPFARYTHWKQTIFYLPDTVAICEDEKIVGELTCKPNQKNRRDLDIAVDISVDGQHTKMDRTIKYRLR